ncbi:AMP-binding protein [Paraglaciecola sp. MB-3u-78]|jgi:long-chain acyl-CoA synthetase|uniref:AMP-binding protein n=1 Tax=Paraglaciecola sp. MB-3u-78 TaxID=2058332 RepID=UPI000C32C38B|nr:AMP-binding protein [Paraglaciecola sp. MB-3u-78]PKG99040.1 AMP-dependent synthetase [Paraglaciecola sp. MB-3u-78]
MLGNLYLDGNLTLRSDFESRSKKLASILQKQGIGQGDTVAVLMRNDVKYLEVIQACRYLGSYFVPLNWHSVATEIEHIVQDSGAKILIAHKDLVHPLNDQNLPEVLVAIFPTATEVAESYQIDVTTRSHTSDMALDLELALQTAKQIDSEPRPFRGMFAYTSGSTGRPKGIKRKVDDSNGDKYAVYQGLARSLMQLTANDRFYVAAPIYHSAPNTLSVCSLAASDIDIYLSTKFDPEHFLDAIDKYKITHIYIVPTMMIRLLKLPQTIREKYNVSSLKYALSTGSACPADIKSAMIEWFGPIFYESYGASEIGFMTLISSSEALEKPGSVGKIVPGGAIKILDENKQELAPKQSGLIYVDLPMFGTFDYTNFDGESSAYSYQNYTSVGDIGFLDDEGYLFINDRQKDMIISGGANIFPLEIESVLIQMDDIVDCAIFGAPDPEFGEMVVAAVQCQPTRKITLAQMHEYLDGKLARFKFPRKLDIHEKLPREDSGKIFKQKLRTL